MSAQAEVWIHYFVNEREEKKERKEMKKRWLDENEAEKKLKKGRHQIIVSSPDLGSLNNSQKHSLRWAYFLDISTHPRSWRQSSMMGESSWAKSCGKFPRSNS